MRALAVTRKDRTAYVHRKSYVVAWFLQLLRTNLEYLPRNNIYRVTYPCLHLHWYIYFENYSLFLKNSRKERKRIQLVYFVFNRFQVCIITRVLTRKELISLFPVFPFLDVRGSNSARDLKLCPVYFGCSQEAR